MNRYIVGQVIFLRTYLTDPSTGDANDPATQDPVDDPTISITVFAPDGTNSTPSLAHVSTGVYTTTFTATQDGTWTYASNSTGAGTGAAKERLYVAPVP